MTKLEKPVIYISDKFPSFMIRVGKTKYRFRNHELQINTQEEVDAFDQALEENPTLQTKFRKVDKAAAEELVRQLMRGKQRHSAVKGPVSSQDILHSQSPLQERDASLSALQPDQLNTLTEEMAADNSFIMTEKAKKPLTSSVDKPATSKLSLGLKENK